jgi:plasmid replication initiation protein
MRETVARYKGFISELKDLLTPMLDELENRISEEMKFSKEEVTQFKKETETEKAAVIEARQIFENAQKNLEEAETDQKLSSENLKEIRGKFSKAYKALLSGETFRIRKIINADLSTQENLAASFTSCSRRLNRYNPCNTCGNTGTLA